LSAIGPAAIVLHGGDLQAPVVLHPAMGTLGFMWGAGTRYDHSKTAIPTGLEGRRYVSYDVFWGRFEEDQLKPEAASQHGRLYLPTADKPAALVLTDPVMNDPTPSATRAQVRPIPSQLEGFTSGRALTPSETAILVAAGITMR
jgi:hypothetical protein